MRDTVYRINPKFISFTAIKVPVLVPTTSTKSLPETLAITRYFAQSYPSMIPACFEEQINALLEDLHDINFFTLTFSERPGVARNFKTSVQNILAKDDISDRYREALKSKLEV